MKKQISRRNFLETTTGMALGCSIVTAVPVTLLAPGCDHVINSRHFPFIRKGEKQLFADDVMLADSRGIQRRVHPACKLVRPVLEADMPWEQGDIYNGRRDRRLYIYGTVMKDPGSGKFRMWYNRYRSTFYAVSDDGINWQRPVLGQMGENNMIRLFDFHSPSIIRDERDPDPSKRYKAIGSVKGGISEEEMDILRRKFRAAESYTGSSAYWAAYSADGLKWIRYPHPALFSSDTITLAQDPETGEYLAFHKIGRDPRVTGRQVFLSVSRDMENWSEPEPVMVTDETDHQQARLLKGGTHSEFYNMSAFRHGSQWLGLVTHFRRTGEPLIKKGPFQSNSEGPVDVQLVHSRNGRKWERCSDRSPVIPLGPYPYDSGSILGVCNSPVIAGDEMWMYYTAMTTTHGGFLPDKEMSVARAAWRLDGMVSLNSAETAGTIDTVPFIPEGNKLLVNADASKGRLMVEVLDIKGKVKKNHSKDSCVVLTSDGVKQQVQWKNSGVLRSGKAMSLRFHLEHGDLFSYTVE